MSAATFDPLSVAGLSVRDIIDRRAAETPDKGFIIDPSKGETVTWDRLKESCKAIEHRLVFDGYKPGESIGYAVHNGADAAQIICGILYGGHVATAVNLVSGKQTIAHVLKHSEMRVVFCEENTLPLLEEAMGKTLELTVETTPERYPQPLALTVDLTLFHGHTEPAPDHRPATFDDGLLMYTSGTTGTPKGVMLTHESLIAGGCNTALAHELTASDCGLCVLPLYHINAFCVSLMGALVSGGSLIMPNRFSVTHFWSQLRNNNATWFSVVPTQISYLLHQAQTNGHDTTGLEALRFGRSASAPLSPDVQQAFEEQFGVPVIETMGLTETAAQILSNPMHGTRKIGSPGIAYGNEVIIADTSQCECLRGEEGEVLVRGSNVMRGYRKNSEATDLALTKDGWLRTGDLGRMDEDGYVTITGRLKELIIKGGENIAPREIDEALYTHPDVIEAAAFACDCDKYGQRVEAAVAVRDGSGVTQEVLITLCKERIGSFKAPDRVHFFPELPKGPSGKIQRLKLTELAAELVEPLAAVR